ncbi:MAG: LytR C-terminal domain-containing protein [bacterium]|nr:MAG: LytR C-terminal domain-containing protein [bacterium]
MYLRKAVVFGLVLSFLFVPSPSSAKYTYLGTVQQPLINIDPTAPGQVFKVWRPEEAWPERWSLGTSADFLRNADNSDDVDIVISLTGAYGLTDRLTVGGVLPYIIRDSEFNQSDLLDLKAFARYRISGAGSGTGLGAQLLASLPTAAQGDLYPFTLDTTLLKLTLAAGGFMSEWEWGLNLGYQSYLESETGDDSDIVYGFYAGKDVAPRMRGVLEYAASTHTHSEGSLEEKTTEATALAGVMYRASESLTIGLSVGKGLSDSFADLRSQATVLWIPGAGRAPRAGRAEGTIPEGALAPEPPRVIGGKLLGTVKPGKGDVLVQISNRSGDKNLGERAARYLEKAGYAVPVVETGSGEIWDRSYIYYSGKSLASATDIKLLFARPESLTRIPYALRGVDILVVLGDDLADWQR